VNEWFAKLAPGERRMVILGGVAGVLILVIGALLPLDRSVSAARARLAQKQRDLKWMQESAPEIAAAGPMPLAPATQESLVAVIDRTARESGLGTALTSSQPSGNGALQVRLEKAPFDLLVAWLARLSEQNAVKVESATMDAAGPGLVNAGIVLRTR
jgi:type II secretory pathway component PulM